MTGGPAAAPAVERRQVTVRGTVQGVGFRPFVHGLAVGLGLAGHVTNTGEGVLAEVEGSAGAVAEFCARIAADAPPLADVESVAHRPAPATGHPGFRILASVADGPQRTLVPPDVATCDACLAELTDPADRRHRHPFISCTHCGPRFTIVTGLPYDRDQTTMGRFPMCAACRSEYTDPADRRFHAQTVACHDCGPVLRLRGAREAAGGDAVDAARALLAEGAIVAVKGIGGYHLACDAADPAAVATLRRRKARGDKPFALMARATADLAALVHTGPAEHALLTGRERPIVLLRRRAEGAALAEQVAPRSPDLGVMLPYTPLHHLLFGLPGDPPGPTVLVLTSGNRSGESIVTDDADALERLAPLTDAWLTHDRPIEVPCDDSVVRICDGGPLLLRRSRGYVPRPVPLPMTVPATLAVGGDLKNTCCLGEGERAWPSAHIGDMDDLSTLRAFDRAERHLEAVTGVRPGLLAADRHPGYRSGGWARRNAAGRPVAEVQHHHAHIAAAMAEHGLGPADRVIGVAFDGTGYGEDGAVWGGEVLLAGYRDFLRFGRLCYAPLPGGDAAVRRPYRTALARLWAAGLPWDPALPCVAACPPDELAALRVQLERGLNCVPSSGMGRLFDAVASITGICQLAGYEAQAAVELEAAALGHDGCGSYGFGIRPGGGGVDGELVGEAAPVIAAAVEDVLRGEDAGVVAARFHAAVAGLVLRLCTAARERHALTTVALTGGVFANTVLSETSCAALRAAGFGVLRHRLVPPNDGGLALGQLMVAAARAR
ncbi:carbamoyltransferase HypF [Kitasatospora sp. NPDC048540]|uniref:carbamoyltransferase HypF n=1 Tax=unclassified Kitasatospora TaxID=2633591 RepID=UPI000539DBD8|nr:carbamoyltransferase HypF [Kitasatospora sp. MBT63]